LCLEAHAGDFLNATDVDGLGQLAIKISAAFDVRLLGVIAPEYPAGETDILLSDFVALRTADDGLLQMPLALKRSGD
jgi:hypothetical protein